MKAILFDVDDTLYDQADVFERAYRTLFGSRFSLDLKALYAASRTRSDEVFELSNAGKISMRDMYVYRIQRAFRDLDVAVSDEEALEFQRLYAENQMHLQLSDALTDLFEECKKKGVRLGVITNGPSGHQWDKVHALGMSRWIPEEFTFVSGDLGVTKPDTRIFDIACQKMKIEDAGKYYVGDSWINDITGAKNAGWNAIWINRRGQAAQPDGPQPDYCVTDDAALCACIRESILA